MLLTRQAASKAIRLLTNVRPISEGPGTVDFSIDADSVAIVAVRKPPLNEIGLEGFDQLCWALDGVSRNSCKGMILTSAIPDVFINGDVREAHKVKDIERAVRYCLMIQEYWVKLFSARFITAAAITIGLIDEIASNKDDAIGKCKRFINSFDHIPKLTRDETKRLLRQNIIGSHTSESARKDELQLFLRYINDEKIQDRISHYLEGITKISC